MDSVADEKHKSYSKQSDDRSAYITYAISIVMSVIYGLYVFAAQVFDYLKTGIWTSHSFMEFVGRFNTDGWASDPQSWIGLHNILTSLPLSFGLIILSPITGPFVMLFVGLAIIAAPIQSITLLLYGDSTWWSTLILAVTLVIVYVIAQKKWHAWRSLKDNNSVS
jgi:hypothetical protein